MVRVRSVLAVRAAMARCESTCCWGVCDWGVCGVCIRVCVSPSRLAVLGMSCRPSLALAGAVLFGFVVAVAVVVAAAAAAATAAED